MRINILLFISITLLAFACTNKPQETKTKVKPNIIWLMAEDMSLDLECYGMKGVKTPNLNMLAEKGLKFNNAFCTNPICSPSRSSMMVGTHQLKINAHNHRSNRQEPLAAPFKPFTYWLRENGYTTILGHHGVMQKGRKIDVNFKHKALGPWDGETKFGLFDKFDTFEKEDQPFFAQIQLKVTHRGDWWNDISSQSKHPVDPNIVELPPYYADHKVIREDWARYLDQVEYADDEVGMLLKELEEKGLANNTVIIFIGDNGRCNIRGKGYLHDPGLRIPLIVYYPERIDPAVKNEVVSSTDITATILDLAGIEIPDYMSGQSFLNKHFDRKEVFACRDLWDEVEEKSRAITTDKWKYIRNDMPEKPYDAHQAYLEFYRPAVHIMRSLKAEGKLNEEQSFFFGDSKPKEELYDLENDPFELVNLASKEEHQGIIESFRKTTSSYENQFKPVSDVYDPVTPKAVDILKWMKKNKPESYQDMLNGVEPGFKKIGDEYRKSLK